MITKNAAKAINHLRTAWRQIADDGPDDVNRAAMALIEQAITALKDEPVRGTAPWPSDDSQGGANLPSDFGKVV